MKSCLLVSLLLYGATALAGELRIVNPILFINKKDPEVLALPSGQRVRYPTKIIFMLYNAGPETRPVASHCVSVMQMFEKNGTLRLALRVNDDTFLVEDKARNLPKIPIVRSVGSFEIVDLRPGEAVGLTRDTSIAEEELSKTRNIVFRYEAEDSRGRYPFWTGLVTSEPYPFPGTKSFHVLTKDPQSVPKPQLKLTLP